MPIDARSASSWQADRTMPVGPPMCRFVKSLAWRRKVFLAPAASPRRHPGKIAVP